MKYDLSNEVDQKKAKIYLESLIEKGARVDLKKFHGSRTLNQNRYFYVCCAMLSEFSGYTIDEVKIVIKDQLEFMVYERKGHRFYMSTSDLGKMDFMALIDFTRSFGENHGCYIPTPDEYFEGQFEIEKELKI